MVPKNRTKSREKNLNIRGKILNWSKISFFEVKSTVFAPNSHKTWFKVEVQLGEREKDRTLNQVCVCLVQILYF